MLENKRLTVMNRCQKYITYILKTESDVNGTL